MYASTLKRQLLHPMPIILSTLRIFDPPYCLMWKSNCKAHQDMAALHPHSSNPMTFWSWTLFWLAQASFGWEGGTKEHLTVCYAPKDCSDCSPRHCQTQWVKTLD
ncbi:hypothetical protein AVEN_257913-1 [Araneus ventricosus]|uniref:Uncharacterized protein n=1 Tax=Araneus ventricosus TaxID=182803 RepID=A0A4Y2N4E8_ARAVE|nr:hypothetical protein AVEN_257913-1 [Araneus ventricosus]